MGVPLIAETHFSASFAGDACHRCGARPSIEIIKERHEFWGGEAPPKVIVCVSCLSEIVLALPTSYLLEFSNLVNGKLMEETKDKI
jgi:hypothetical protein